MLSRMTPRLLTWGVGDTVELSMVKKKLSTLDRVDLVPTRRSSVLSLLSLRKFEVNQDLISEAVGEGGGRESGVRFTGQIKLGVIREAVEM